MKSGSYMKMLCRGITSNSLVRKATIYKSLKKLLGADLLRKHSFHCPKRICFQSQIKREQIDYLVKNIEQDNKRIEKYMNHCFNLLGTGWVKWQAGEKVRGYAGEKCNEYVPEIKNTFLDNKFCGYEYTPITWNVDIRTGYLFREKAFSSGLIEKLPEGVDIKVPWELGRMYHWPEMALYAWRHESVRNQIIVEFYNQMKDFMDSNPIGEGVQFYCAMEVGIRAINLLVAYDLLLNMDTNNLFSCEFRAEIESYIYMHARVIEYNMEYDCLRMIGGNHYLTDLCALIWISAYFESYETKRWYKVASAELYKSIGSQFFEDGSNFECSTAYHRLSSELCAMGLLAIRMKKKGPFFLPTPILNRISGMCRLLRNVTGMDGHIIQIGDNDSGRVLKLFPVYDGETEDTLGSKDVIDLLCSMLGQCETKEHTILDIYGLGRESFFTNKQFEGQYEIKREIDCNALVDETRLTKRNVYSVMLPVGAGFDEYSVIEEKTFGLVKVIGRNIELYIRSMPRYSDMELAHAHDDVFHYELCTRNGRIGGDCGSVAYTSSKRIRDYFAEGTGHNVPIHGTQVLGRTGVFSAKTKAVGYTTIKDKTISVVVMNEKYIHVRKYIIERDRICICDFSDEDFKVNHVNEKYWSIGYGQLTGG